MTAAPADSPFDPHIVADLATILGPAGADALRQAFARELRTEPAAIVHHFAVGGEAAGRAAAHRLKGAALVVGARAVANAADRVEFAQPPDIADALSALTEAAERTIAVC